MQIRNFKSKIRTAIEAMRSQRGEIVFAQYAEDNEKNRFFDLGNMLFYNLGTSAFANCAAYGIAFSSLPDKAALCRQHSVGERKHVYHYQYLPLSVVETKFADLPLMAKWIEVLMNGQEADFPAKYWKAIRSARNRVTIFDYAESPLSSCFALQIELYLSKQVKLANKIKPLLDGVICAFHGESAKCLGCLADFCMREHC